MKTLGEFTTLLDDHLGMRLTEADLALDFDEIVGWDSAQLLHLLVLLERETGRVLPFARLLEARSLAEVYDIAVTA